MPAMSESESHAIRISAKSLDELREALGVSGDLQGKDIDLGQGLVLKNVSLVKSSGFDSTAFVLQGVMTIVTTTTSALLIAYLKERLLGKPGVTATVDGKAVEARSKAD